MKKQEEDLSKKPVHAAPISDLTELFEELSQLEEAITSLARSPFPAESSDELQQQFSSHSSRLRTLLVKARSKQESAAPRPAPGGGPVLIPDLICSVVDRFQHQLDARRVVVVKDYCRKLARTPFRCNGEAFQSVVYSVLENAVRFGFEEESIIIQAWIVQRFRCFALVEIAVTDVGSGLPDELLSDVFDVFWKPGTDFARTDLQDDCDLAGLRNAVRLLNGELEIRSLENVGTAVVVQCVFPLYRQSGSEQHP